MTRTAKTTLLLVGVALTVLLAPYAVRLWPSALSVRLDPALTWRSVTVTSSNLAAPQQFTPASGAIHVGPISHGLYSVGVQYVDGEGVWSEFLHLDAGFRRRVDLFLAPSPRAGYVHLRLTANRWFLPRRLVIFDGEVSTTTTSPEKPATIAGP